MAGKGRKFKFHGAFKSKKAAVKKERSASCKGCFIVDRMVRGVKRHIVLGEK